jgi:hypothetical protein
MSEIVRLFRILLAAPSDVTEEHTVVESLLGEWNVQHGERLRARLELLSWRTHSYPATGSRPQALINRQFADRADIVIAVFWRKLGSHTGKAVSGTVEEIERALSRRKKVMVYFSERTGAEQKPEMFRRLMSGEYFSERTGAEQKPADSEEQERIERFKRRFARDALYGGYADLREFEIALRKDLALVLNDMVRARRKR